MKIPAALRTSVLLLALTLCASAQKMQTPAGEAPGPWLLGTIGVGKGEDGKTPKTTALKGLAIKVGEHGEAAVCYDLDLCRMAGAWTGKFTTPMNLMSRGEYPTAMGEAAFTTGEAEGFISSDANTPWKDPRPEPFGPLPQGQARFKGFYVNGDKTILKWDIGGTEVLERPEYVKDAPFDTFVRSFRIGPRNKPLGFLLGRGKVSQPPSDDPVGFFITVGDAVAGTPIPRIGRAWYAGLPSATQLSQVGDYVVATIPAGSETVSFSTAVELSSGNLGVHRGHSPITYQTANGIAESITGGPARWPETVTTQGEVSADTASAYVVDTIKLPDPNPWNAPMFLGGFDFFPDGRAAVCTFHGDVFIVSGIDAKLEKVVWKRFASGLYHALGLKIVNGEIYVTCRDGIWRLRDLNKDGECDFYEAFNHDVMVTKSFHEFVFDLQTDPAGNFYFAKAGPVKNGGRGFDEICAHHGSLLRVSPDGKTLDVVATGFRAPNGIGVGPRGELTSGDNEGTWTPACKINWIRPGGFYGVVPLAHRDPPPTDYDRPLCWLPKRVDNSGGSQVWVPEGGRWGAWGGKMLHLSYGQSSLYGVLREEVKAKIPNAGRARPRTLDHFVSARNLDPKGKPLPAADDEVEEIVETLPPPNLPKSPANRSVIHESEMVQQGGVTKFPLQFQSGIMRARFNPLDGQLYVAGLRGWQTNGLKNGALQRVRYTGAPVRMPIGLHATKRGVRIDFTCALDAASAGDPQNWNVEVWNYLWSSAYGSPELSTLTAAETPTELGKDGAQQFTNAQLGQKKHDPLTVKSATLSADKKSVLLEIPDIKPVMQMQIRFTVKSADGTELRSEIINTIHALGE